MRRCRVCRDVGYVELRAFAMREEDVARVPERERSVRRAESSFLVRAACSCRAGRRWYSVRVTGTEMERAPKTWEEAVLAVVRAKQNHFKRVSRVASAMQLPERFVRAILVRTKKKREAERHAEEDQEGG